MLVYDQQMHNNDWWEYRSDDNNMYFILGTYILDWTGFSSQL